MTHDHHEVLPNYDERQIYYDGCQECETRGKLPLDYVGVLDTDRFKRAWQRAADWNRDEDIGRVSLAERGLLNALWRIQVALERHCQWALGQLP